MQTISKNQIRELAKLKQKKYRDSSGTYLITGIRAVSSALESGSLSAEQIIFDESRIDLTGYPELQNIHALNIPVFTAGENDFKRITDEQSPQGIALVARIPRLDFLEDPPEDPVIIYLDRINDPGNLGTIIRTALWFGVNSILLSPGSVDPYNPKVVRASTGYIAHLRVYEEVNIQALREFSRSRNYSVASTIIEGGTSLYDFRTAGKQIILFGAEADGINPTLNEVAGSQITIPKPGHGESLNLGVSVALVLYQIKMAKIQV
ncbi:MAG: TrmH family RNA methyltransferase [Calditrichaceae bacterium]